MAVDHSFCHLNLSHQLQGTSGPLMCFATSSSSETSWACASSSSSAVSLEPAPSSRNPNHKLIHKLPTKTPLWLRRGGKHCKLALGEKGNASVSWETEKQHQTQAGTNAVKSSHKQHLETISGIFCHPESQEVAALSSGLRLGPFTRGVFRCCRSLENFKRLLMNSSLLSLSPPNVPSQQPKSGKK